jgi:hypothetical protein
VLPALVYVQTVERALGTASFVVVPRPRCSGARACCPRSGRNCYQWLDDRSRRPVEPVVAAAAAALVAPIAAVSGGVAALSVDRSRPPVLVGT